jgi:hypothetical protein
MHLRKNNPVDITSARTKPPASHDGEGGGRKEGSKVGGM